MSIDMTWTDVGTTIMIERKKSTASQWELVHSADVTTDTRTYHYDATADGPPGEYLYHAYLLRVGSYVAVTSDLTITIYALPDPPEITYFSVPSEGWSGEPFNFTVNYKMATQIAFYSSTDGLTWNNYWTASVVESSTSQSIQSSFTPLVAGTYYFKVAAINGSQRVESSPATTVVSDRPQPPVINSVTYSATTINLGETVLISVDVSDALTISLEESTNGQDWSVVTTVTANTSPYQHTFTYTPTIDSYVRISAMNDIGTTDSTQQLIFVIIPESPEIVEFYSNRSSGPTDITILLTATVKPNQYTITGYEWKHGTTPSEMTTFSTTISSSIEYQIHDDVSTAHYFQLVVNYVGGTIATDVELLYTSAAIDFEFVKAEITPGVSPLSTTRHVRFEATGQVASGSVYLQARATASWTNTQILVNSMSPVGVFDLIMTSSISEMYQQEFRLLMITSVDGVVVETPSDSFFCTVYTALIGTVTVDPEYEEVPTQVSVSSNAVLLPATIPVTYTWEKMPPGGAWTAIGADKNLTTNVTDEGESLFRITMQFLGISITSPSATFTGLVDPFAPEVYTISLNSLIRAGEQVLPSQVMSAAQKDAYPTIAAKLPTLDLMFEEQYGVREITTEPSNRATWYKWYANKMRRALDRFDDQFNLAFGDSWTVTPKSTETMTQIYEDTPSTLPTGQYPTTRTSTTVERDDDMNLIERYQGLAANPVEPLVDFIDYFDSLFIQVYPGLVIEVV
jgi:hypothetical protein